MFLWVLAASLLSLVLATRADAQALPVQFTLDDCFGQYSAPSISQLESACIAKWPTAVSPYIVDTLDTAVGCVFIVGYNGDQRSGNITVTRSDSKACSAATEDTPTGGLTEKTFVGGVLAVMLAIGWVAGSQR